MCEEPIVGRNKAGRQEGSNYGHTLAIIEAALFTIKQLTKLAGSMRKNVWNN